MPDSSLGILILIVVLAVAFGFANGFNDAANAIATAIGTRVLSPRKAVVLGGVFNFAGAATGIEVARTIGKGILIEQAISEPTMIAGVASVIIWTTIATYYGFPVSITHGLVAGLGAAGVAYAGSGAVVWSVLQRVLTAVVTAPLLGFIGGFVVMVILFWVLRKTAPDRIRRLFSRLQIFSAAFMAYSHGKNDGQMPIGIITMALVFHTQQTDLWERIPWWVIGISAIAISSGMIMGGWRVIRTLGLRVTTLRPVHGFAAQFSAAAVIETASQIGIPVSTTHCMSTAIMGVGSTTRLSAVRWGVARNIVAAWIITFPVCGGLGYLFAWLLKMIL